MSHLYVSPTGTDWMDLDDDDLEIFASDQHESNECNESDQCEESEERDGYHNADDAATCAIGNGEEDIYNAADHYYEDTSVSLNVANLKYRNEVWHICRALPAYTEFSFDEHCYYPYVRVQYRTNWLDFKLYMGGDLDTPMRMRFSPLRLSLTREYDDEGGFIIHEAGTLIDGPLFPHTDFKALPDDSGSQEKREEPQQPSKCPPCVPGFRDEDELAEYESETEDTSACQKEGVYASGPPTRSICEPVTGIIDDDEPSDEDGAEGHARSTAGEDTGSSAESTSELSCDGASPSTSVSSTFSDSSEDGVPESDVASISESEDDDVCVTLDTTPTNIQEGVVYVEKMEAAIQPITTAIEGRHTTPMCLDTISSTEIKNNTSTSAAAHRSVCERLVSEEDAQTVPISISDFAVEVPVIKLPPSGALPTSESADDNQTEQSTEEAGAVPEDSESSSELANPVPVTVEADVISSTDLSSIKVKSSDYTPPTHCSEDAAIAHVESLPSLTKDAGVSPGFVFSQPPPTTPLVWDVVCTTGFALSSLPWLRMGVAAAGIVVNVAATLLRR